MTTCSVSMDRQKERDPLRQIYTRTGKRNAHLYSRYACVMVMEMKLAQRKLKKLRTITGRVLKERQK